MMKKKLLSGILTLSMLAGIVVPMPQTVSAEAASKEIVLEKSTLGNPIAGFNENGEIIYAGDPNILVDGDTVYLYVGHDDTSSGGGYTMPNYLCYSTQDLENWKYEGPVMEMTEVAWADNTSAWAAQVIKHEGKYYMLYCAENKGSYGKEVGVAVAESPTGPFVPQAEPYFHENLTNTATCEVLDPVTGEETTANKLHADETDGYGNRSTFGWEDIDPTFWLDTDENGNVHPYLMWGNTNVWMCELEDDLLSIKDQNGDGEITQGYSEDIWFQNINSLEIIGGVSFTEAPWLYRRQNEAGEYYGDYYMFFATHWREEMGYATCSELGPNSLWTYGGGKEGYGHLMEPTATSNTNHPAVFDFKGKTYFVYHNGSLPGGSGYRRVICVEELKFNEDGSIDYIQETSTGISGTASRLIDSSATAMAHDAFNNSVSDPDAEYNYPKVNVAVTANDDANEMDALWEIEPGKADKTNASYVTIESFNKPGMYLRASGNAKKTPKDVVLSRDHNNDSKSAADGTTIYTEEMTFRTLESYDGKGVTFESVAYPGTYMASVDGKLVLVNYSEAEECVFEIAGATDVVYVSAEKAKRSYATGSAINVDDIRVRLGYEDSTSEWVNYGFTTNAASIDMSTPGIKELVVTYTQKGVAHTYTIPINVYAAVTLGGSGSTNNNSINNNSTNNNSNNNSSNAEIVITGEDAVAEDLPEKGSAHTVGKVKYVITKVDEYNTDGTNGTVTVKGMTKKTAKSVVIPAEVEINGYSFAVNKIDAKAFQNCKKLKTITIGDNVKSIGKNAFKGIHKKATFKVSSDNYDKVKKLLKSKVGFKKKTMKIKEV